MHYVKHGKKKAGTSTLMTSIFIIVEAVCLIKLPMFWGYQIVSSFCCHGWFHTQISKLSLMSFILLRTALGQKIYVVPLKPWINNGILASIKNKGAIHRGCPSTPKGIYKIWTYLDLVRGGGLHIFIIYLRCKCK